ncbi:hypothetical protein Tco_0500267 [Tanacetum coccineum]
MYAQSLVFKDEMEELEMEMEIGLSTDVKHVTHIGFDDPLVHVRRRISGRSKFHDSENSLKISPHTPLPPLPSPLPSVSLSPPPSVSPSPPP